MSDSRPTHFKKCSDVSQILILDFPESKLDSSNLELHLNPLMSQETVYKHNEERTHFPHNEQPQIDCFVIQGRENNVVNNNRLYHVYRMLYDENRTRSKR